MITAVLFSAVVLVQAAGGESCCVPSLQFQPDAAQTFTAVGSAAYSDDMAPSAAYSVQAHSANDIMEIRPMHTMTAMADAYANQDVLLHA